MATDFYRQRLAHAQWTWREGANPSLGRLRKDRASGRAEKHCARAAETRDIDDQLTGRFDPLDDYDMCTSDCCAVYLPGVGITRKRFQTEE